MQLRCVWAQRIVIIALQACTCTCCPEGWDSSDGILPCSDLDLPELSQFSVALFDLSISLVWNTEICGGLVCDLSEGAY